MVLLQVRSEWEDGEGGTVVIGSSSKGSQRLMIVC